MICLAFEFTSRRRSVAVGRDGVTLAESVQETGRETPVFALVDRALRTAGIDRAEVGLLALDIGPGSYTGIRIAISTVQGWALGSGIPVVPVGSFEILRKRAAGLGRPLPWTFAVDAQRREFAVRTWNGDGWDGDVRLVPDTELVRWIRDGRTVLGPDLDAAFTGIAEFGPEVLAMIDATRMHPAATDLPQLATAASEAVPAEKLAPVYLREAAFVKAPPARPIPGDPT
jgi:tRNA threonylcarbamoyladenosine biosynthesis protein TsaB